MREKGIFAPWWHPDYKILLFLLVLPEITFQSPQLTQIHSFRLKDIQAGERKLLSVDHFVKASSRVL